MTATQNAPTTPYAGYARRPVNNEGKHRTSLNAYKHGLTGKIHLFSAEEEKAFETHCAAIVEALAPVGALETSLAETIAQNRWRLLRVASIESGFFAAGHNGEFPSTGTPHRTDAADLPMDDAMSQARTWLATSDKFQLLALYEGRINRTVERNMAELRTLRAERKAALDQALEEARVLAQHAQSKGEKYDPARDFPPEMLAINSDFSLAAIARHLRLSEALDYAKHAARSRANPKSGAAMPAAA